MLELQHFAKTSKLDYKSLKYFPEILFFGS